jgi:hypothetical protein
MVVEGKLQVKERKHPKLRWVDPGAVRAVKGELHAPTQSERGALLGDWVGALRRAYGESGSDDFKGLKTIAGLKGLRRRLVVFLGERAFRTEDGIEALPAHALLEELQAKTL